jgi:hypothetical protein
MSTRLPLLFLAVVAAHANTITFSNLTGPDGAAFTTYSEGGFTVSQVSGLIEEDLVNGNPAPSLALPTGTSEIQVTEGGSLFDFESFDMATDFGTYTITGMERGSQVFTQSGGVGDFFAWETVANNNAGQAIDTVTITFVSAGDPPNNLDNIIVFNPVTPEPDARWLFLVGAAGFWGARRKRRQVGNEARVSTAKK